MKNKDNGAEQKNKAGIIGMSLAVLIFIFVAGVVMTKINNENTQTTHKNLSKLRMIGEAEAEAQKKALLLKSDYEAAINPAARASVLTSYSCDTSGTTTTTFASVDYRCHIVTAQHSYFSKEVIILSAKKDIPGQAEWGRVMLLLDP